MLQAEPRSALEAKTLQQRSDFYRCKQRGRGFSLGALPNKVDRVAVKQAHTAGVIEENRHQVSDLCAAALGQRQNDEAKTRLPRF